MLAGLSVLPALAEFKLDGEPKVAMIIFAQKNDGGWSQSFDEARQRMEKSMGVAIPFVENVPENATAIRPPAELFIGKGYNIIIGSAFGYSDTFKELAAQYPNVAFLNGAGITNGPNLESFYGRTYETQYLCGMAAAAASKTGKLGFVAANPFGLVNWTVNAFQLGAEQINPDATTTVIFTGAHDANALAVANGKVDAATIADRILDAAIAKGHIKADQIQVVWESAPIPESPMVWRKDLSPETKAKVKAAFLSIKDLNWSDQGKLNGFKETSDQAYDIVRETAKLANIDLKKQK